MSKENKEITYFFWNAEEGKKYSLTTWYRCVGIQDFVEKVQKKRKIIGVIFSNNNLGFIIEDPK